MPAAVRSTGHSEGLRDQKPDPCSRKGNRGLTGPSSCNPVFLPLNLSPPRAPASSMGLTSFSRASKKEAWGLECVIQDSSGLGAQKLIPPASGSRGRPGHPRTLSSLLFSWPIIFLLRAGWAAPGLHPSASASPRRRRSLSPRASRICPRVESYRCPQSRMDDAEWPAWVTCSLLVLGVSVAMSQSSLWRTVGKGWGPRAAPGSPGQRQGPQGRARCHHRGGERILGSQVLSETRSARAPALLLP